MRTRVQTGAHVPTMKLLGHDFGKESVAINGRKYKVKQELGRGGFAIIVLVKDTKTKQKFALKRSICREESQ